MSVRIRTALAGAAAAARTASTARQRPATSATFDARNECLAKSARRLNLFSCRASCSLPEGDLSDVRLLKSGDDEASG